MVELTRVSDPTLRARLANAIVDQGWTVQALQQAIEAAKNGDWYDTDPATPGTQPPAQPAPAVKLLPPGRLLARAQKWVAETDAWSAQWTAVAPDKLTRAQRTQAVEAVQAAKARLEVLLRMLK